MAREAETTHRPIPTHRSTRSPSLRRARFSRADRSAHFEASSDHPSANRVHSEEVIAAGDGQLDPAAFGEPQPAAAAEDGRTISSNAPMTRARAENPSPASGQVAPEPSRDAAAGRSAQADAEAESRYESSEEPELSHPADDRAESDSEVASLGIPHGAMPAPLRGSLESLERQNQRLADEGLERIEDEDDLAARIANRLLVPLPASQALTVNPSLTPNHRYCRPWTARFLADLAREHDAVFHRPLEVSSAVRTVEYQRHLMGINGNAAPAEGDVVSPHLTGATIDIAKDGLSREEIAWMRKRLLALQNAGKIDVEEEFQQACFHITVYKSYAPPHIMRRAAPARPSRPLAQPDDGNGSPAETPAQGL
jgi:hypothetical protein